jgi:hypothetical protein
MIIEGKIIKGVGFAATDLSQRLPEIAREYDELRDAHPATINVYIGCPVDLTIDFKTDKMICVPPHLHRIEFVRVQFEFPLGTKTKAWIFQPYGHHWGRGEKSTIEILASKYLKNVALYQHCKIHVLNGGGGSSSTSVHYLKERRLGRYVATSATRELLSEC